MHCAATRGQREFGVGEALARSPEWARLLDRLGAVLDQMSCPQLSKAVWALAKLGIKIPF